MLPKHFVKEPFLQYIFEVDFCANWKSITVSFIWVLQSFHFGWKKQWKSDVDFFFFNLWKTDIDAFSNLLYLSKEKKNWMTHNIQCHAMMVSGSVYQKLELQVPKCAASFYNSCSNYSILLCLLMISPKRTFQLLKINVINWIVIN